MNILVTGANGQLGREMRIVAEGSADTYLFTDISEAEGLQTVHLDITDLEAVRHIVREHSIDAIVNCAAWTNVDAAEAPENRALVERLNVTAPENLARAMREAGGWLIHISTDYVFGLEPYNTPCRPSQQGTPTGVYGETKKRGEEAIISQFKIQNSNNQEQGARGKEQENTCKEQGARSKEQEDTNGLNISLAPCPLPLAPSSGYIILRTAWLYSEFGRNFLLTMLRLTSEKPSLRVVFDQCGTPTYALDLAHAIETILHKPVQGIYHYSNEGVCSWYDFTQMIARIAGHTACDIQPCRSEEYPSPVRRPAYSVLDKQSIRETFGVSVPYWVDSLEKCIKRTLSNSPLKGENIGGKQKVSPLGGDLEGSAREIK